MENDTLDSLQITESRNNKYIKKAAIISYIVILINILFGIVFIPWVIDSVGKSQYAIYSLVISVIGFFSIDFGMGETISRYIAKYKSENNNEKMIVFVNIIQKIYFLISMVILIVLVVVYFNIESLYTGLTNYELETFKSVFLISSVYCSFSLFFSPLNGILIGNEKFLFIKITELINKIIFIILSVITLLSDYDVKALIYSYLFAGVVVVIIRIIFVFKSKLIYIKKRSLDKQLLKSILSFSFWTMIIVFSQRITFNLAPTYLGIFSNSNEIALFSIALSIEGYVWTFSNALNGLFLPKLTRLHHQKRIDEIDRLTVVVGKFQLFVMALIIFGFLMFGKDFVTLWIGFEYSEAAIHAFFLVASGLVVYTQIIPYTNLLITKKIKYYAFSSIISVIVSSVLSIILIPIMGSLGASVSIFIGSILGFVVFANIIYAKILKMNVLKFFRTVHAIMVLPVLLSIGSGILLNMYLDKINIMTFVIKVIVFTTIYCISVFIFTLTKTDKKDLVNKLFMRKKI